MFVPVSARYQRRAFHPAWEMQVIRSYSRNPLNGLLTLKGREDDEFCRVLEHMWYRRVTTTEKNIFEAVEYLVDNGEEKLKELQASNGRPPVTTNEDFFFFF